MVSPRCGLRPGGGRALPRAREKRARRPQTFGSEGERRRSSPGPPHRIGRRAMTDPRLLSLLHFADSAFPTGGYAHSFGLETYCQAGLVRGREDLERFLEAMIEGSAGPCDATAAVSTLRAAAREDLQACQEVDATLEAMKPVKEFREGSRQ